VLHQISPRTSKKTVTPVEEEFIAITKDFPTTYYTLGCFTLPVALEGQYIKYFLYDSGTNPNLMSLKAEEKLGNIKMYSFGRKIGYVNGQEEKTAGIIYFLPINIVGFDFLMDIVVAKTKQKMEYSLFLGRTFFAAANLILDGE